MQNRYRQITIGYLIFLLLVLLFFGYTPTNDGEGYIELARKAMGDGMLYPSPSSIRGYPFVWNIGEICMVEGALLLFHTVIPVLILNCLLKALTAYLIALTARQLFNERIGLIALLLFVAYPNNWGDSTMLVTEIPAIAMALIGIYLILTDERKSRWLIAGLLFAISSWIRPLSLIYIGSVFLCHLIWKRQILRNYLFLAAIYLAFTVVVGLGSKSRTGYFLYQTDTMWFNMAEATYETSTKPHYDSDMYPKGTIRYIADREHKDAVECTAIWRSRCLDWLKGHPVQYLKKVPGRLFWMYFSDIDNISAFKADKRLPAENYVTLPYTHLVSEINTLTGIQYLALISWIYYIALLCGCLLGMAILLRGRQWQPFFLPAMIIIGGSLAIVLATHGEPRFKDPFMPWIILLAALSLSKIGKQKIMTRKESSPTYLQR